MNFNAKLQKQFTDFNISIPNIPRHKFHLYADYIELIALFTKSEVTKSDILDRLFDEGLSDNNKPETNDKNETWINEVFDLIYFRNNLFSDD